MWIELPDYLEPMIRAGLEPIIQFRDDTFMLDLDVRAKSGVHLYWAPTGWRAALRYNEDFAVNDIHALRGIVIHAMHGREHINPIWQAFLNDEIPGIPS